MSLPLNAKEATASGTSGDRNSSNQTSTPAVALLSKYLFDITHVNRLEIRMDIGNKASEKVAIKCGFKAEGIARGANFVYGKHVDMCVYALLREEHDISAEQ